MVPLAVGDREGASDGIGVGDACATINVTTSPELVAVAAPLIVTLLPDTASTVVPAGMQEAAETAFPGATEAATAGDASTRRAEPAVADAEPLTVVADVYVGASVGEAVGAAVGDAVGAGVGTPAVYVGASVGDAVGAEVGESVGKNVGVKGMTVGHCVGALCGASEGRFDGCGVGPPATYVGTSVGDTVGVTVGLADGSGVGRHGRYEGSREGTSVGGDEVGATVGHV